MFTKYCPRCDDPFTDDVEATALAKVIEHVRLNEGDGLHDGALPQLGVEE